MNDKLYNWIMLHIIANSLVQLAMVTGIIYASVYFHRASILWFYIIPFLMRKNYEVSSESNKYKNGNEKSNGEAQ